MWSSYVELFWFFVFFSYVWAPSVCHQKIRLCVLQRVGVGSWLTPQVPSWVPLQEALWKTATIYQYLSNYSKTWEFRFWAVGYVFANPSIGFFLWFLWIGSHGICLRALCLSSILSKNLYWYSVHSLDATEIPNSENKYTLGGNKQADICTWKKICWETLSDRFE